MSGGGWWMKSLSTTGIQLGICCLKTRTPITPQKVQRFRFFLHQTVTDALHVVLRGTAEDSTQHLSRIPGRDIVGHAEESRRSTTHGNGSLEKSMRSWGNRRVAHHGATWRLAKDSDAVKIATKCCDVFLYPGHCRPGVPQAVITWWNTITYGDNTMDIAFHLDMYLWLLPSKIVQQWKLTFKVRYRWPVLSHLVELTLQLNSTTMTSPWSASSSPGYIAAVPMR